MCLRPRSRWSLQPPPSRIQKFQVLPANLVPLHPRFLSHTHTTPTPVRRALLALDSDNAARLRGGHYRRVNPDVREFEFGLSGWQLLCRQQEWDWMKVAFMK